MRFLGVAGRLVALTGLTLTLAPGAGAQPPGAGADEALRVTSVTPSGTNVPPGRQIVVQFNRPVVPIGRMERRDDEVPIAIEPGLACDWRWIDTSALACQLGDGEAFRPATRYDVTIGASLAADDGATLAADVVTSFTTARPRVTFASFSTWLSPGTPVIRVIFDQPVSQLSVADHLYFAAADGERIGLSVEADENDRELPRFMPLPGELRIVDFGQGQVVAPEDEREGRQEARRVWRVTPLVPLPEDTDATLVVEPGLESSEGPLPGDEVRVVVEFATFPAYRFNGIVCWSVDTSLQVVIDRDDSPAACNPMRPIALSFSAPTIEAEVRDHVGILPDLAGGRTDYDPWANASPYSRLGTIHRRDRSYFVWLPERLQADRTYALGVAAGDPGPRDEFGRPLAEPIALEFRTDHRPPDFTIVHPLAVVESGVDSEVPLYVTNLEEATLRYRLVTPDRSERNLSRSLALADVEDVQYGVLFGVREMLEGASGAVFGELRTAPFIPKQPSGRLLFAEVTPFQVHAKLGHFNTLVWVTELSTGEPVRDAQVSIYVDRLVNLTGDFTAADEARTDRDGIAMLGGTETLDPTLGLTSYSCGQAGRELCPRLFVRVDHDGEMALMPLAYEFEVNPYRVSNFSVFSSPRPRYGHLQSWGTTAQGVYRAGDTIEYKIWVRNQSAETQVPAPAGTYRLEIVDPAGQVAHRVDEIALSDFGAFDGRFDVPATAPVGWYQFRLTADFDEVIRNPMRVLVTDFTPASFRVSTTIDGDRYVAGSEVTVEAEAALFSGGPYRDADARVSASLSLLSFRPDHPLAAGFRFDGESRQPTMQLTQETGPVDADGRLTTTFSLPDDLGRTMTFSRLLVEAAVRDERGRYVASTATARVLAVDRIVGLRASRWIFSEDEPAEIESIVVDAAGNPIAGTRVGIAIERLETRATRVRGAGNAFLTEYVDEWLAVAACDSVSVEAPRACGFLPEDPGRYRVTATIADTAGRTHSTSMITWVQGKGRVVWNAGNDDALDVVPEQTAYQVGDTARYLVQNPYPGAKALVTIERYGVIEQWVEEFETSTPVLEFEVGPDYLPGFYLSILVMSPRVEAPLPDQGELDLGKPAFKMAYINVPVADPYKQIEIDVRTDAGSYKPRDTVTVEIRAEPRNRESREPIELAVVVLDEAVLDLIQGGTSYFDPYAGFNRLDGLDVLNYGLLTRLVGRQRIELKGANPGGDGGAALAMRSLFRFVAYFDPSLELDGRGRGSFEFELPDNLTGWRVLALGATPTDRFGLGQAEFTATLPTEIRPLAPNQVAEGDAFIAGASVMNRTDRARVLELRIEADGDLDAPVVHEETLALAPFERGEVKLPLTAARLPVDRDRDAGAVRLSITARDAVDGDGLEHELPVLKQRALQTAATFGTLSDAAATETLAFPEAILTDAGEVGVEFYASVIGNVDGAFRAARESNYLFWEQVLTKGVMASHYRRLEPYTPPDFDWPDSGTLTASILAQASGYQAPNGGMSFLVPRDDYVSPYLSAYTALSFAWLERDGHEIPAAVEDRLLAYLDAMLRRDVMPDFYTRGMSSTVRAVALAALALRGELTVADLTRYREHVEYMSLFGKAHYLMAAAAVPGGETIASEVGAMIMQSSTRSAGRLSFNEQLDDGYTRILATPLRTQCAILSALTQAADTMDGATAFALVRTITQSRGNRSHWENAQENMFCMNALIDYASRFETETPAIDARAAIDGVSLGTARFESLRDGTASLMRPIAAGDAGARRELGIEASGPGRLYYAARMSYAEVAEPGRRINAGIDVRRELSVERDGEWVLLGETDPIAQGELVRVDLFVSLPTARHFVVVDDPIPGGLEPINRDLANASVFDADAGSYRAAGGSWYFQFADWRYYAVSRYSFHHRELRHDAARFYADYLPPGNYLLSYTAQAIAAGSFSHMPASATETYDPDVFGRGLAGSLTVTAP
jgi:hypothetical protein